MSKGKIYAIIIALLAAIAIASVAVSNFRYNIVTDLTDVRDRAEALRLEGESAEAKELMEAYCGRVATDVEARITLGEWYEEDGEEDEAIACYEEAAVYKPSEEKEIPDLTTKNKEEILFSSVDEYVIEITPDVKMTRSMTFTVSSENLFDGTSVPGRVTSRETELIEPDRYLTTNWIEITPDGAYLAMTGGFNNAFWQFMNESGEISYFAESTNTYQSRLSDDVTNYQMARVEIPSDAVAVRVTYKDIKKDSDLSYLPMCLVYGRLPGRGADGARQTYEIPDLAEGDSVVFRGGVWSYNHDGATETLSWPAPPLQRGSFVKIGGTLLGRVSFSDSTMAQKSEDGIYSVKFSLTNPTAMGEREDDAKNLGFNMSLEGEMMSSAENDFDGIYPWSEMRLCAIDGDKIMYSGEYGFATDGSAGDVFVEIPSFYSRVETIDGYEKISITKNYKEGFSLDEAFLTETGTTDKIYVAAYISSEGDDGKAQSVADAAALERSTAEAVKNDLKDGYSEIDFAAYGAIQKLFLVETAIRNSQILSTGITDDEEAYTGDTDYMSYVTGADGLERGKSSFKYRNIENPWGGVGFLIDGVYAEDGVATLTDRKGDSKTLTLPAAGMIKSFAISGENMAIFLPLATGATASTFTGDYFFGGDGALLAGGGRESGEKGGLFAVEFTARGRMGGRMMRLG